MTTKLSPCPKCGAIPSHLYQVRIGGGDSALYLQSGGCDCFNDGQLGGADSAQSMASKWNKFCEKNGQA